MLEDLYMPIEGMREEYREATRREVLDEGLSIIDIHPSRGRRGKWCGAKAHHKIRVNTVQIWVCTACFGVWGMSQAMLGGVSLGLRATKLQKPIKWGKQVIL